MLVVEAKSKNMMTQHVRNVKRHVWGLGLLAERLTSFTLKMRFIVGSLYK